MRPGPIGSGEECQGASDCQGDKRFTLAANVNPTQPLKVGIAEEEEDGGGRVANVGREGLPAEDDQKPGHGGCGGQIGCRRDRLARPDMPKNAVKERDSRGFLVPDVAIHDVPSHDSLAGIPIETLVAAGRLHQRGGA